MWYICLGAGIAAFLLLFPIAGRSSSYKEKIGRAESDEAFIFGFPDLGENCEVPYKICAVYWRIFVLLLAVSTAAYYLFPASFPKFHYAVLGLILIWACFFTGGMLRKAKAAYRKVPEDLRKGFSPIVFLARLPAVYADACLFLYCAVIFLVKTILKH